MIVAEGPNGERLEFPDDTPPNVVKKAIKDYAKNNISLVPEATDTAQREVQAAGQAAETAQATDAANRQATRDTAFRNTAIGVGATAGGALGAPLGPAGFLGGSALGAAAGEALVGGVQGQDPAETLDKSIDTATEELLFTGGISALRPLKQLAGSARRSILGVGPKEMQAVRNAEKFGINVSPSDVSRFGAVNKASGVVGKFPFLGTPVKRASARKSGEVTEAADRLLFRLGPTVNIADAGVDINRAAKTMFKGFRDQANELYSNARRIADEAGEVIPTENLKKTANEMLEQAKSARAGRKPVAKNPILDLAETLDDLPDNISGTQYDEIMDDLDTALKQAKDQGFNLNRGMGIKNAAEIDLRSTQNQELVEALSKADEFFAKGMTTFETATAKKFGRVTKNAFKVGLKEQGMLNEDELFRVAFNSKSPKAMRDLRELVGGDEFRKLVKINVENAFDKARNAAKANELFSPETFSKALGLDDPRSPQYAAMKESLSGTGISVDDLQNFAKAAKDAFATEVPNVSQFVARRAALGGASSGLRALLPGLALGSSGAASAASGTVTPVLAVAATLATRRGMKVLSDPRTLKLATRAMNEELGIAARRSAALRMLRIYINEYEEPEPTPVDPQSQTQNPGTSVLLPPVGQ